MSVEFVDNTADVLSEIDTKIEAVLEGWGIQGVSCVQEVIDREIPRHPGSWYTSKGGSGLRGSIHYQVEMSENAVYVGTNNEHAIYNELGTGIFLESDDGRQGRQTPWSYQDENGNWHRTNGMKAIHMFKNGIGNNVEDFKGIAEDGLK